MLLALFYVVALVWGAFICALAAIVAGAAVGGRMSPVKHALVGVGVGAVSGVASVYLFVLHGAAIHRFVLLFPDEFYRFAPTVIATLLIIGATTLTATAVGALATRSVAALPGYAIVGAAFGLVLGIAHAMLLLIARYVALPAMGAMGLYHPSPVWVGVTIAVIDVTVNITLAVVALRLFRGRRSAEFADDAARTC